MLPRRLYAQGVLGINARNQKYTLRVNERRFYPLVDDKLATKRMCQAAGIPVPRLLAVAESPLVFLTDEMAASRLGRATLERLVETYGRGYARVVELAKKLPDGAERLCPQNPEIVAQLHQAVAAGVLVNVESMREIPVLAEAARSLGLPGRVAIRVNPDFELKGSGMKMGGGPKQFGVDVELVPQLLRATGRAGLSFEGFHLFAGSQNLRAQSICEAQRKSYELALRLAAEAPAPVRVLNLGGGFGIPYFPGEQRLDLAPVGANLAELQRRASRDMPAASLVIELGRYLVGEAGLYVTRIVDRKLSRGQVFLVGDGGLNHHLSASGNFGQVVRKNYPVVVGNRVRGAARETVSVVGPLCTPLDLLADSMEMAQAEIGDLIVVFQSGAYGLTASPTAFLSHPPPAEILA